MPSGLFEEQNPRSFEELDLLEDVQFEFEDEENSLFRLKHEELEKKQFIQDQVAAANQDQLLTHKEPGLISSGQSNMSSDHMGHDMHQEHNMADHVGHGGHGGHAEHSGMAEHSLHAAHAGQGSAPHMMMDMTFHGGVTETILFEQWHVNTVGGLIASFIAIFVMALLYEGLKYYRKHLLWKTYSALQYCAVNAPDKAVVTDDTQIRPVGHMVERKVPTMLSRPHAWQTALHGMQVLVSYVLMLVFMTYNLWLCAAVVLGSAVGYFLFGWRESVVVDFTEHCH